MRRMRVTALLTLMALATAGTGVARAADLSVELRSVSVAELPQGLTVAIDTSAAPRYRASVIEAPTRLVIDMSGSYAAPQTRWTGTPAPIKQIRGSQWKVGTARLVVELTRDVAYRIEETPTGLSIVLERGEAARGGAAKLGPPKPAEGGKGPEPPKLAEGRGVPEPPSLAVAGKTPEPAAKVSETPKSPQVPRLADGAKTQEATKPAEAARATELPKAGEVPKSEKSSLPKLGVAAPGPATAAAKTEAATSVPSPSTAKPESVTAGAVIVPVPTPPSQIAQTTPGTGPAGRVQTTSNGTKLITLDFKDADTVNVLRILGAEGGRNIAVGDDVKGKVTVSLHNVTWEQALDTILEARGLQKVEKGGVIRIVSSEQLAKERELQARADEAKRKAEIDIRTKAAEAALKEQQVQQRRLEMEAAASEAQARGPLKEEILRLAYADPGEIANTLQGVLGLGRTPIPPCVKVTESDLDTKLEFQTGGGVTSGPIAEPPFSQLFGPPRSPEQEKAPAVSISQDVLARGLTIRAHCPTNSLFLRLFATDLDRVKKLIRESLDVALPQVKIEARMEILDRTALEAIGIQWGGAGAANAGQTTLVGQGFQTPFQPPGTGVSNFTPSNPNLNLSGLLPVVPQTGLPFGGNLVNLPISALPNAAGVGPTAGLAFGIVGTNWNVNLALQALSTLGKTRTLARPEIVTVENHRATMSLGEEIPYATVSSAGTQIQFKEALLKLEVIPMVIREKLDGQTQSKIKMFVVVENNSRGDVVNLGTSGSPPAINKRRARTQVLMSEGERLVIGGVSTGQSQNTIRKVPVMGDIPVLGWLFKQKENFEQGRELVVFVTPSVLKADLAGASPGK